MLALALVAVLLVGGVGWSRCGVRGCPDVARLGAYQPDGAPRVVDRYGEEVGELRLAEQVVVALEDLPGHVADAFLAVEDKRFREHRGIDWRRVGGALFANLRARGIREGSSTITMQLARNLFAERIPAQRRTLGRKLLEIRVAREIERAYSKDEILELYLNHIYFGGGTRGIEAASQHYFRKSATRLTLREAALLAALPKAPTHYDPREHPERAKERRDLVLALMAEQGRIAPAMAEEAQASSLGVRRRGRRATQEEPFAGYFLERVRRELEDQFGDSLYRGRVRIVSTLDRRAQHAAERELEAQLRRIEGGSWGRFRGARYASQLTGDDEGTDYLQGAVMLLEAASGDVLAWVGGRQHRHSRFDRVERAQRQLGSAFKPFVFAAALEAGVPPTQQLSDLPLAIQLSRSELWEPRNYGDSYLPAVTVRQALVESRNVATVRLAEMVGLRRVVALAERAGLRRFSTLPSIALGAGVASPLNVTRAYSALANLGVRVEPRFILRVEDEGGKVLWEADETEREEVLDPAVAFVVTDLLTDAVRRGTGAPARATGLRVPAAGKTGTTNERQDVWFVGYTPDVVGTVWIGFDRPQTIVRGASGGRLAAPVWGRIVRDLYRHRERPGSWPVPPGVTIARVDAATGAVVAEGCEPPSGQTYREVFLAGTEPPPICPGGELGLWARLRGWWGREQEGEEVLAGPIEPLPTPDSLATVPLPPAELEGLEPETPPAGEAPWEPGQGIEILPGTPPEPEAPATLAPVPVGPAPAPPPTVEPVPVPEPTETPEELPPPPDAEPAPEATPTPSATPPQLPVGSPREPL